MNKYKMKKTHLDMQSDVRSKLFEKPILKQLFFELTLNCNEHCQHCGSRCGDVRADEMSPLEWKQILDQYLVISNIFRTFAADNETHQQNRMPALPALAGRNERGPGRRNPPEIGQNR